MLFINNKVLPKRKTLLSHLQSIREMVKLYHINHTAHPIIQGIMIQYQMNVITYQNLVTKMFSIAVSNKKNVKVLPIKKVEAEEILCAPTVCTTPVVASFTLMLEEPKQTITKC